MNKFSEKLAAEIKLVLLSHNPRLKNNELEGIVTEIENLHGMQSLIKDACSWSWRYGDDMGK